MIEIRHRDGMITRYGHLRGFASGLREGQVVGQGQVIGFVGSTGLSTGPHLHFETLVNGVSKEPTRTLRNASGVILTGDERVKFAQVRDAVVGRLGLPRPVASPQPATGTALPVAPTVTPQPPAVVGAPK
jgi:Peptidase family M23